MTSNEQLKIAIVGGGIGGLCLAAGLVDIPHLDVHIYESVPEYKDVGAGLALHMNAIKAMDLISPRVKQAYFSKALTMATEAEDEMSTTVSLAAGPNAGAVVAELGKAKGRKTIARSDLLAGLRDLIPPSRLHFNKRLSTITTNPDETIALTFQDSTTTTASCLIGCDGIHSPTRSHLLGPSHPATPPKNHSGWQIYRTLIPTSLAAESLPAHLLTTVPILCGPKGHINMMPLHHGTSISAGVAVRNARDPSLPATAPGPDLDPDDFASYTPDARAIVNLVARDTSASWSVADHDPAPTYARGNICIMGDAAHAAYPFAGQGAAQAIEDAAVLCALFRSEEVLDRGGVEGALRAYDEVRRPRSQEVVEIARGFGTLYAMADEEVGEDLGLWRRKMAGMAGFSNGADLGEQNRRAVARFEEIMAGEGGTGKGAEQGVGKVDEAVDMPDKKDMVKEVVREQVQAVAA